MAGRRPLPKQMKKVKLTVTIKPKTRDYLYEAAMQTGYSISELIERAIIKTYIKVEENKVKKN